jgi:hypothetical protein
MRRQLKITLNVDGTIEAETIGIKGPSCMDEITRIEALVGEQTTSSRLTENYSAVDAVDEVPKQVELNTEGGHGNAG